MHSMNMAEHTAPHKTNCGHARFESLDSVSHVTMVSLHLVLTNEKNKVKKSDDQMPSTKSTKRPCKICEIRLASPEPRFAKSGSATLHPAGGALLRVPGEVQTILLTMCSSVLKVLRSFIV